MRKQIVVQIIPRLSGGGAEKLAMDIASKLEAPNDDSLVVSFSGEPLAVENTRVVNFRLGPRNILNVVRLRRLLRELTHRYDAVVCHAHLTWPFYYTVFAAFFLEVVCIYTEHSTENKRRRFPILGRLERIFYKRYAKVVCISNAVATSLHEWVGSAANLRVIENGVELPSVESVPDRSRRSDRKPALLAVGSLRPAKGFDILIETVSELRNEIRGLTIVGEGKERGRLERLIRAKGLEDIVTLTGWRDDLSEYYKDADIQLIPSRWEGFGLVAVEGMAYGLPLIVSDVDGLNEVVAPNQESVTLVSNNEDPKSWVVAIRQTTAALEGSGRELAICSRRRAEGFSIDRMVARYRSLYDELLQRPTEAP